MIIDLKRPTDLNLSGVYRITNTINNKLYIGSTCENFIIRWKSHINTLRRNTHKNAHLQNAFNKYGEKSFIFEIIEVCEKEDTLNREQLYLNKHFGKNCYNINPNATTLNTSKETIQKQIESRKLFYKECLKWYNALKNNEINFTDIPEEFKTRIKSYLDQIPWNKGKKYKSTEHLRVPHKKSDRSNVKNTNRSKSKTIYVYDNDYNFLDSYRSSKDLEEMSMYLTLPIKSRFSKKRMGKPICYLCSGNINKAIKENKIYKGLRFFNKPLHPGMDDVNEPKSVKSWNANTEVS